MIREFKKTIGYICPSCALINIKTINLFDLSGKGKTEFCCDAENGCHAPCFSITPKNDKYAISVDCISCGGCHIFNIKKITFWQSSFFMFACPEAGDGVLFLGDEDKVRTAIEEQEAEILPPGKLPPLPAQVLLLFEAIEHLSNLSNESKVSCCCGSHDINIELRNEGIVLCCRDCGITKIIPDDEEVLKQLLNTSAIVLD